MSELRVIDVTIKVAITTTNEVFDGQTLGAIREGVRAVLRQSLDRFTGVHGAHVDTEVVATFAYDGSNKP